MTGMNLKKIFFSKLPKHRASQNIVKTIISEKQKVTAIQKTNSHILNFYKNLLQDKIQRTMDSSNTF